MDVNPLLSSIVLPWLRLPNKWGGFNVCDDYVPWIGGLPTAESFAAYGLTLSGIGLLTEGIVYTEIPLSYRRFLSSAFDTLFLIYRLFYLEIQKHTLIAFA